MSSPVTNRTQSNTSKESGSLHLVFLSRISEKKNLLFLLRVLAHNSELSVQLDIYGPIEDKAYWKNAMN